MWFKLNLYIIYFSDVGIILSECEYKTIIKSEYEFSVLKKSFILLSIEYHQ